MKVLKSMIIAVTIAIVGGNAVQASEPVNLYIAIDTSSGNIHLEQPLVASRFGSYLAKEVQNMPLGSRVFVSFFGASGKHRNPMKFKYQLLNLSNQHPEEVGQEIKNLVSILPELVKQKRLKIQHETNLVSTLYLLRQGMKAESKNRVILISDLLEFSQSGNLAVLEQNKRVWLEPPTKGLLKGVTVTALGAGSSIKGSKANKKLKSIWISWFKAADVLSFTYLTDY